MNFNTLGAWGKVAAAGWVVSFVGSIPVGTLNITAFRLVAAQRLSEALWFTLGVVLVELALVRVALAGNRWVNPKHPWFGYLLAPAVLLLGWLAYESFVSANQPPDVGATLHLPGNVNSPFLLGILMSSLNPLHLPFWMGWNAILSARNLLFRAPGMYLFYLLGVGVGTVACFGVYMLAGHWAASEYARFHRVISLAVGVLYLGFAAFLCFQYVKQLYQNASK